MAKYLIVALTLIPFFTDGQSFYSIRRNRSLIFSGGTGTASYFGELKNPGDYIDPKPNLTAGLQYYIFPRVAMRAEICWFQLKGDDAEADRNGRVKRNLSFVSNNYEVTATAAVNLFQNAVRYYQRPSYNVYGFVGIGFLYFNPTTKYQGDRVALRPLKTEGVAYSRFQPVVPYGIGVRAKLGPFFNLAIEGGYRLTFTDYLDDVSTVHPDKTSWTDPVAIALSDRGPEIGMEPRPAGAIRGNPETNDGYFLLNVKLEYYLPVTFTIGNPSRKLYNQKRRASHR